MYGMVLVVKLMKKEELFRCRGLVDGRSQFDKKLRLGFILVSLVSSLVFLLGIAEG